MRRSDHLLRSRVRRIRGFTLIEILVVIVVIAILASVVAPEIFKHIGTARSVTAKAQIQEIETALDMYRLANGRYPTTQQGLSALNEIPTVDTPPNWNGPYLKKAVPMDPWGVPYIYLSPGQVNLTGFDLLSYGADGKPGGTGEDADILSWQ